MPNIGLENSWLALLQEEFDKPYMQQLRAFLQQEKAAGQTVFPPGGLMFNALNSTPVEQVKVVILGQDPYHGPGQAHGLSFSVPDGIPPPPSLVNIFKELHTDLGLAPPSSGNLSPWAQQGVLLLNATLSVRAHVAGSHQGKGWEQFTDRIMQILNDHCDGLVFMLWGAYAQQKAALINPKKHCILRAPHPSPLSSYRGFFGCKHFSRANHWLVQQGKSLHWPPPAPEWILMLNRPRTIAIAGAGLMGRLLAWRLALAGHSVSLLEAGRFDQPRSAAYTAAAMVSPLSEVVISERAIFDMGMRSLTLWPEWLDELKHPDTPPIAWDNQGSLVIAHRQDEAELQQFYQDLNFQLGADNPAQWLNREQLAQLEPDLSDQFYQGLLLPGEAHLDNRQLLSNLLTSLQRLGARLLDQCPVEFLPEPQCPRLDLSAQDILIDCRGMGAKTPQGPLRGVRGEVLWVETQEVKLLRPIRLMHPRYKLYLVPKPQGRYIIGATEIESEDRSPMSLQSLLELGSALYTLNPAFAEARITELDANLRPSYWDNLPQINLQTQPGGQTFMRINGLYRHGYLLAPYLAEQALAQLNHHSTEQAP
jgi:glycine oxidase